MTSRQSNDNSNTEYDLTYPKLYDAHGNVVLEVSAPPDQKKAYKLAKQRGGDRINRSFAVPPPQEGAHRHAKQARSRLTVPYSG